MATNHTVVAIAQKPYEIQEYSYQIRIGQPPFEQSPRYIKAQNNRRKIPEMIHGRIKYKYANQICQKSIINFNRRCYLTCFVHIKNSVANTAKYQLYKF